MIKSTIGVLSFILMTGVCSGATLTGKVRDSAGNPVPDLKLVLVQMGTGTRTAVVADGKGSFVQSLTPGEYEVYPAVEGGSTPLATVRLEAEKERCLEIRADSDGKLHITELPVQSTGIQEDPSLASIRDYRIQTPSDSGATANEVRHMADVINPFPAQKGGRIHGSLYEFHRNDNFDARNFFDPLGKPLPEYKRNQFGASLGFAVGNSLNFLGSYDGLRIVQGSTLLSHVPTAAMKHGDFGALGFTLLDPLTKEPLPGNRIPESRIHPVATRLLSLLPDPNRDDSDRNFVNNTPVVRNRDSISIRGDYQMKSGSSFFARYSLANGSGFYVHPLPSFGSNHESDWQNAALSYSPKINNRLLATWRLEYERTVDVIASVNAGQSGLLESLGIPGLAVTDPEEEGYPDFQLSSYASFGDSGLPYASTNNRYSFEGGLTFTPQKHTFRVGGGLTASQGNNNRSGGVRTGRFTFNGYYSGDAFADFLFGVPDSAMRSLGTDRTDLRRKTWSVYARDEWRLTPKWNLSLGVSYNYFGPYQSIASNVSVFYPLVFEPPKGGEIVIAGSPRAIQLGLGPAGAGGMAFPDRNDWAPNVGLAYHPLGSNRLVIRSGFATYYSPIGRDYFVSYLGRNYPFYYTESSLSPIDKAEISMDSPFSSAAVTAPGIRGIEPHLRTAYVNDWYLSFQGDISRQWRLEGRYDGNKAVHMPRTTLGNVPLPAAGDIQTRRSNPEYGRFTILAGSGSYSRNAVNLDAERRLADGLSLKTGFSLTEGMSDLYYGNPANPRNLSAERARFDSPARQFYINYIVDLPFGKKGRIGRDVSGWMQPIIGGWRLSGITHLQDGSRFTVTSNGDPNNDGVSDDRPDRLASGVLDASERSIDKWFATQDFADPRPYSFGNSGRNILTGPSYVNWDLSVIKQTKISDGNLIEFRLELFNAFNQVNFDQPSSVLGTSLFGKVFGASRAREIEVALRYSF